MPRCSLCVRSSGFQKPSQRNQEAFDRAVLEIAETSERLLVDIGVAVSAHPAGHEPTDHSGQLLLNFSHIGAIGRQDRT